jgi:hypothetical protein
MRVSVSHNKPKEEVRRAVDRSFDDLFRGSTVIPIRIQNERRLWQGSLMTFSFDARAGILSAPIKGTVEVTDRDLIIDSDLGVFERLLGVNRSRAALEGRIRGLLK